MTTKEKIKRIKQLEEKVINAKIKHQSAIDGLVMFLQEISGLELFADDLQGDGFGFGISGDTHMSIPDIIKVIEEKGTFTEDDIIHSF